MTKREGRFICAWCGRDLGPSGTAADTHGICPACERRLRERVEAAKEQEQRGGANDL